MIAKKKEGNRTMIVRHCDVLIDPDQACELPMPQLGGVNKLTLKVSEDHMLEWDICDHHMEQMKQGLQDVSMRPPRVIDLSEMRRLTKRTNVSTPNQNRPR